MATIAPPPARDAPAPPALGLEETVAQLKAAIAKDPAAFTNDEAAKALLEKLNEQIAQMYMDGDDDDEDEDEDFDDEYDDRASESHPHGLAAGGSPSKSVGSSGRRSSTKHPRPVDLWKAAHETDGQAKPSAKLTTREWDGLVDRLNESSKRKQAYLMRAQHAQIAAELAGLSFTPHISEKSRELAAHNKSLPQRIEALMRKKRAKLEKIRHEKITKELAEATFKPDLDKSRQSVRKSGINAAAATKERRQVGHLMQYELDKRIRAAQRRQLIQEIEERELTFTPNINKNSARIVERLNREREARIKGETDSTGASPAPSRAARKALAAALAAGVPLETAAAVTGVTLPTDTKVLKTLGYSYLPGHEEETFHPRINPRSAALHRPGLDDKDVFSRLYEHGTASRNTKVREASRSPGIHPPGLGPVDGGSVGSKEKESSKDAAGYPIDDAGDPAPGHPQFFNVIAFEPGRMDFVLRKLVPVAY